MKQRIFKTVTLIIFFNLSSIFIKAQTFNCNGNFSESLNSVTDYQSITTESLVEDWVNEHQNETRITYYIPVVVRVLYHTPAENISDADIYSQLAVLNQDFARTNPDASNTPSAFFSAASSVNIQFCLADRDTNGNPTTGITRDYTDTTVFLDTWLGNNQYYQASHGGVPPWDPIHYLNIYVIHRSYFSGTASNGANGNHGNVWGGVAIQYSDFNTTRTLTHEIGHYFGLSHIFGGTSGTDSCGDDYVSDTPPQGYHYNCPTYPTYSCGTNNMFMNYMDYTSTSCKNMFTHGQATRMEGILNTVRFPLLSSNACSTAGISNDFMNENIFIISPNPFPEDFQINISGAKTDAVVSVYNLLGQQIFSSPVKQQNNSIHQTISLCNYSAGVYIVSIKVNGENFIRKVVKE